MFAQKLHTHILEKKSRLCVGLDPRLELIPQHIKNAAQKDFSDPFEAARVAIVNFNKRIIDIVAPYAAAVKPQIAFYEQYGPQGLFAFQETITYAKKNDLMVIVDAKRGDISSTAEAYANALLGSSTLFDKNIPAYDIDCVTINPFLGKDSLQPFVDVAHQYGKGLFILVKTSNPGSRDIQALESGGMSITEHIAHWVAEYATESLDSNTYSNIGAVVGATFPDEAKKLRALMPRSVFLVPGIGPQGGDINTIASFFNSDGLGAIVNSSRGIVFSFSPTDRNFEQYITQKVINMKILINQHLS